MKEKIKIFKEIIILTIINAGLISIISCLGRIIALNIMKNLDSTNSMRNVYIRMSKPFFSSLSIASASTSLAVA